MAKFELKFIDLFENKDSISVKKVELNNSQVIRISLRKDLVEKESVNDLILDKSTAIKFAKTLRTEINKITEREVSNG